MSKSGLNLDGSVKANPVARVNTPATAEDAEAIIDGEVMAIYW
jgi:hypothetical protein